MSELFKSITGLERGLDASWKRNSTILDNIANVDTPNFKSSKVEFESLYKKALDAEASGFTLKRTRKTHMDIGDPDIGNVFGRVVDRENTTMRMDGNNVDIDEEMSDFVKNVIYYTALTNKVTGQFAQLRMAIREGR